MLHPYKSVEMLSIYQREQAEFAELQEQMQKRKRRQRRRRIAKWILRRL